MTIKELKEELSKYNEKTNILFFGLESGYNVFFFIDDDPLENQNRIDIVLIRKEQE